MIVAPATSGAHGIDTWLNLTSPACARLHSAGYAFAVQYLGRLTSVIRDAVLESGLALLAVTTCRKPGWAPSEDLGTRDGADAVTYAQAAGLPEGMTLYLDFEGPGSGALACAAHVDAWAHQVTGAGYVAGLYVGYGVPLTPAELYALAVTTYWHSCSDAPDVAVRGYAMTQLRPPNVHVCGVEVDLDTIHTDGRGETPPWLTA